MSEPRYIIAQYAADIRRMETRNIGILLWAEGQVTMRFISPDVAKPIVRDLTTFERWIAHWKRLVAEPSIAAADASVPVSRAHPDFVDALLASQSGNYLLYDAGIVHADLDSNSIHQAADFLFNELVSSERDESMEVEQETITTLALEALTESGIAGRDDFRTNYDVSCNVLGLTEQLRFNYAIAEDEKPTNLFQRVTLKQQSVTSAALMFYSAAKSRLVSAKNRCAALVSLEDTDPNDNRMRQQLRLLRRVAEVIDLSSFDDAVKRLRTIAA